MATLPMAVFGLEVPAGDVAVPAVVDIPAAFRITMAAIDPSAEPEESGVTAGSKPRATLKLIRQPLLADDYDEDDSDFDADEMDRLLADGDSEEDSDEDEEANGGPSDPSKSKKARKEAAVAALIKSLKDDEDMDVDDAPNGVNGKAKKGKGKATDVDQEDDDEDDEEDSDEEGFEPEEYVICTLDTDRNYQQPLDITIGEDEHVWFKVSGTHTIYLTGNYVEPAAPTRDYDSEDEDDYDSDEYDLTPDEDELDEEDELSEDELDDLPRVTEVDSEEEVPALVAPKKGKDAKGKNKRPAEEEAATLDDMISEAQKTNGDAKLSKKQAKKLKNNEGKAVEAKEEPSSAKSDKKVSFAEKLEQGPTPSPSANKDKANATGPRVVQGVTIDVKKVGSGEEAKKGDRVGMRYIGKLKDGKMFDSNKKGKPFSFKLGIGEVIKGWDIGVAGIRVGGERRLTVPAHLAYGSQATPGIPPNSTLVFDIKCVELHKK
ncbi:FK506-binding protein 4 [Sphaceloma murrayae]|uniref:FK506-binding protein n=1 Tax=Sphaceloma murrayae TaxID=2082308 RepID=A0A2K1QMM7_9PEZI|nr:FK506-binding protein 4 [Sphaceloma murrayae]